MFELFGTLNIASGHAFYHFKTHIEHEDMLTRGLDMIKYTENEVLQPVTHIIFYSRHYKIILVGRLAILRDQIYWLYHVEIVGQ